MAKALRGLRWLITAVSVALLAACGTSTATDETLPEPTLVEVDFPGLGDCRARIRDIDERIEAAGAGHGAYYRVPHFPYLRTDRVLASFADEVDGIDDVGTWVRRMRELDFEARDYELKNLGLSRQERAGLRSDLFNCGRGLAFVDLDDPDNLALLRRLAQPPDEARQGLPQALDALLRPVKRAYVAWRHHQVRDDFRQAANESAAGDGRFLEPEQTRQRALAPGHFDDALTDPLGFPGMIEASWRAIAEVHAPQLWTDGTLPAAPHWRKGALALDDSVPTVYYHIGFSRRGEERLVQVYYILFFDGSGRDGAVDSLVWRVTLDRGNRPLFYDSVPASGWPHMVFPLHDLRVRDSDSWLDEPVLVPQADGLPEDNAVLRLSGNAPRLRRVTDRQAANPERVSSYRLRPYEALYTLPTDDEDGVRSLFTAHGDLANGESDAGQWNRLTGLPAGGAIRQIGRQPSRLIGTANFDDPYLMDRLFGTP